MFSEPSGAVAVFWVKEAGAKGETENWFEINGPLKMKYRTKSWGGGGGCGGRNSELSKALLGPRSSGQDRTQTP